MNCRGGLIIKFCEASGYLTGKIVFRVNLVKIDGRMVPVELRYELPPHLSHRTEKQPKDKGLGRRFLGL